MMIDVNFMSTLCLFNVTFWFSGQHLSVLRQKNFRFFFFCGELAMQISQRNLVQSLDLDFEKQTN